MEFRMNDCRGRRPSLFGFKKKYIVEMCCVMSCIGDEMSCVCCSATGGCKRFLLMKLPLRRVGHQGEVIDERASARRWAKACDDEAEWRGEDESDVERRVSASCVHCTVE
jgi:hypothetical protein